MINYADMFTPFVLLKINGMKLPEELTARILSLEVEYDNDKDDMLVVEFDNRDYYVSDSPYIEKNKKITSVSWGYIINYNKDNDFIIKDYEGLEQFKIIAYRNTGKGTGKSSGSSSTGGGIKNPYGGNAIVRTNSTATFGAKANTNNSKTSEVKTEDWKKEPMMKFIYKSHDNGIIMSFDPSYRTNDVADSSLIQGLDIDSKTFFEKVVDYNGEKMGISDSIKEGIKKAGVWVIDAYTGVEKFVEGEVEKIFDKILPPDLKAAMNEDITGGVQGANETNTEASMQTIGLPNIKSGINIDISNVGKKWSGKWHTKTVTHKIGEGYTLDWKLVRPNNSSGKGTTNANKEDTNDTSDKKNTDKLNEAKNWIIDGFTGEEILIGPYDSSVGGSAGAF